MTSRGNPSVSPPATIPQQRHVSTIPSGTPPPNFYTGQQQGHGGLPQGYEFIPQQQPQGASLLSYQAYGSALNEARGPVGTSGRGVPPHQNIPQGGNFYQQPGQNMRPQQSQQGPGQQYYLSAQAPTAMRPRQPLPQQQAPNLVYLQQPSFGQPNNMVITQNMQFPRGVYAYPPNSTYSPQSVVYFQNGGSWRPPGMPPTATQNVRPQQRERKIVNITDPNTGKDITDEILKERPHSAESEDHDDSTSENQEICKTFTRLVADRLKMPDDSSNFGGSADQGAVGGTSSAAPSSQYQQPPPQQQVQHTAMGNPLMRPPPSGHRSMPPHHHIIPPPPPMQQPPPPATPPHDMQHQMLNVNLSMPPPAIPLRQPTPVQVFNQPQLQQHPPHHGPRPSQPTQQQQPVRPQMPPVITKPQQPPQQVLLTSQPISASPMPETAIPKVEPNTPGPEEKQKPQAEAAPQDNIPILPQGVVLSTAKAPSLPAAKTPPVAATSTPPPPVKEESPEQFQKVPGQSVHVPSPATKETSPNGEEEKQISDETGKDDGASTQGFKDGRKAKKSKKDINRKDIGGSDMDAFIDNEKPMEDGSNGSGEVYITRTNNALEGPANDSVTENGIDYSVTSVAQKSVAEPVADKDQSPTKGLPEVAKDLQHRPIVDKSSEKQIKIQESQKAEAPVQVESKQKVKKKKKKKGRKSPPIPKAKHGNDGITEDKENETLETDAKPPLPPSAGEQKSSQDRPEGQEVKAPVIVNQTLPETAKVSSKEPSPQPSASVSSSTVQQPKDLKNPVTTPEQEKTNSESTAPTDPVAPASSNAHVSGQNQNQQLTEDAAGSIHNSGCLPGNSSRQTERQSSQPVDNGIPEEVKTEPVIQKPSDSTGDGSQVNHQKYNDENEPPTDSSTRQRGDEEHENSSTGLDNDGAPNQPPSDKAMNKAKKDGRDKLQYDRAYLIQLRACASSQTKPEGLPNLEIILDRPVSNTSRNTNTGPLDFTPSFFQAGNNQRHPPQMGKSSSRGRQRPDVQMPQRIIKSVSIQNDVTPLHQSEKPWKPAQKQQTAGEAAEKRKSLESEVLFIMNRLTPTNFDRLAKEMQKLDIKTYDDLQELVKIFFDKVAMETKFVEAYAQLCKVIAGMRVPPPPDSGIKDNQCTFRVMMLTKCQQEFEADKSIIFEDPEEKKKKIEAEMPEGPERAEKIENTLYQMKLKRLKFYGNIRFIGELFKLGMLTENIMHDCIFRLLKARDDDSLVSLCNLITTVGQNLDTDKAKQRMDQYFNQMAKIADERKSRIKFTLKDAIDLRNNNWVPRKEQAGPKKIGDIHKDFIQEQATKQFLQSQPLPPRNDPQPNSRRGSRQRQDEKPNDDGWNTVGSKSIRIDASKMKLSKNVVDENNIQLGPGGGMNKFSMWSRGSFGGAQPTQDDRQAPANRFSALRNDEDRRNFQRSPSRGDNSVASRGMRQGNTVGHGRGKIPPRSSTEGERRDALASARSIVGRSQNSSRDNSWNREDRRPSMGPRSSREGENPMTRSDISLRPKTDSLLPPSAAPSASLGASSSGQVKKLKPMTEEEMEHKAKTILEEYLNIRDLEEAKLCVMELEGQEYIHALVSASLNDVLERSTKDRELTGQFFSEMVNNKLLSLDKYLQGLSDVLQYAEDMVIDIPKMWSCLAQMISPMLLGGALTLARLQASFKPNLADKCCAKLLAEILLIIKEQSSESEAAQMWQSSGCKWSDYLSADEVNEFIKDKKLGYLENPVTASSGAPRSAHQDLDRLTDDIEKLVRDNSSNSQIFAYIDKHVPGDKQEKTFIRALMTAVAKSSISDKMKANEEVIKARKDVLHRYIKNTPELELQALYAIQALMHKLEHPSGVIVSLFDTLYDEEVITEDAFKKWEKSSDPQELEGKGPCSLQLTQFFTWLTENEEPETSS